MNFHLVSPRSYPVRRILSAARLLPLVGLLGGLCVPSPCVTALPAQALPDLDRSGDVSTADRDPARPVIIDPAVIAIERSMVTAIAQGERSVVAIARGAAGSQSQLMIAGRTPPDFATGIVVAADGLILTNQHVVGDPQRHDYVVWIDRRPYRAEVKAANPYYDLAILQIDLAGLTPITFGDTTGLKKGQLVLALGNPWAIARDGSPSASWGIISNLNRQAPPDSTEETQDGKVTLHHFGGLIQTDVRLQRGTSGGALLNLEGKLIGITSSLAALEGGQQAAGFAIRMDDRMREVIERLKQGLDVEVGLLGISPEMLLAADQEQGLRGVRAGRVWEGTAAALSGLRPDDVITHVNQQPVVDRNALFHQVSQLAAGDVARITALRGNRRRPIELDVILSKKRLTARRVVVASHREPLWRGLRVEFCSAVPFLKERATEVDPAGCVAVAEVRPDSPAWQAGLRQGHFISHVLGQRVTTPAEFKAAVADRTGEVAVRLTAPLAGRDDGRIELGIQP